jgi:transposase
MRGDKIVLSGKEVRRLQLLGLVSAGKLTLVSAAEKLGLGYRQAKRLKQSLEEHGPPGLAHGNRGRHPANRLDPELCRKIVLLAREKYALFNDSHFTEMLASEEGIRVGRETVRRLLRSVGIGPKRKRKARRHHRRRPRKAQEGLMMLWDGSPHAWFGLEHPPCCLMAAMDDATGKVLAARFEPEESGVGYFELLSRVVRGHGIPQSVYQDRHGALYRNDDWWSLEEQLAGRRDPTQVGAALAALGIEPIRALTPQAKGRVERLFNTFQDRLVAELALRGIGDMGAGNRFLSNGFLGRFNRRFAVPAQRAERAYATVPKGLDLKRVISFGYRATVHNDNTVRLGGLTIDIPPGPDRRSYAKAKVEVRQLLDGSWRVYYQDRLIARHGKTPLREARKVRGPRKKSLKGVRDTLWVYLASKT